MKFPRVPVIVAGIVLVGAVLRIVGVTWGLPQQLNPDEWVIVSGALDLSARNSFEPSIFLRPDHLEIQLSYLAYTAYALIFTGAGVEVAYAADPGTFLLISRVITALFGTATVLLAFFIGRRFSSRIGIIAAALFALFPPFVIHSHYASPDIPLTAVLMGLVLACMHYLKRPGYVSLLVASSMVSLAISIKYPGAIAAVAIAVVVVIMAVRERRPWRILQHGATAIVAVLGFLFLISPVLFTNIRAVVAAIQKESRTNHPGADGLGFGGNLLFYGTEFLLTAGIIITLTAFIGVFFVIRGRMLQAVPLGLGAFMWIVLSALPLHWERWGVPMYTSALLFAAIGAGMLPDYLEERGWLGRWRRPALITLASIALLSLTVSSLAATLRFLVPDTRISTAATLDELGITRDNTIFEGYSPFVPQGPIEVFDDFRTVDGVLVPRDESKEYLLLSSCVGNRYNNGELYASEREFYTTVRDQFDLVLSVEAVPPVPRSPLSVVTAINAVSTIAQLASGRGGGCDLEVYSLSR